MHEIKIFKMKADNCILQGVVFLNGFNLGRYWPVMGPQVTLYVPAPVFRPHPQVNVLVVFELEWSPCGPADDATMVYAEDPALKNLEITTCKVEFVLNHVLDGSVFRPRFY